MKIIALTGAGISAPSGLSTFRDEGGLWAKYRIEDVATPEAWQRNPGLVLEFYNARRAQLADVRPNAAHETIAAWEREHEVVVITQNVDDLHERAGSSHIIHLHGELSKARSTVDPTHVIDIGHAPIALGDTCPAGGQLRPHIVWFGEAVDMIPVAAETMADADLVVVVGTSLQVYPAAGLIEYAPGEARRYLVDTTADHLPPGYEAVTASAEAGVPELARRLGLPTA
jgi:NAD-dependent deacetylase